MQNKPTTNTKKDTASTATLDKLLIVFFQHQLKLKMFHFQTKKYGAHKTSDAYLEKFEKTFDKFMEVAQGVFGRVELSKFDMSIVTANDTTINQEIDDFVAVLRNLDDKFGKQSELLNIRDELVGDAEQLKYLLTFN